MGKQTRDDYLVEVVAKFSLSNGPRFLVVPLESCYLRPDDWCLPVSIIVDSPMVDTRQEICSNIYVRRL